MSGSNGKEDKKARKKEIKEFKKAFKQQTGVDSDSNDPTKLLDAFKTQLSELSRWSTILVDNQPTMEDTAGQRMKTWAGNFVTCQKLAQGNDKKAAASKAREMLAVLLKVNESVRKQAKSKPVTQTVGDRDVSVFITDIPGYDKLSPEKRKEAVNLAAQKIGQGMDLFDGISGGTIDVDDDNLKIDPNQVESIVWAMKSKAQEKNKGPYQKGAMTVPDGDKLRKFLDKCPEVYARQSSHLRDQQGLNKEGGVKPNSLVGQSPRGMDFYNPNGDDKPGRLPAGMNALLFQQVTLPGGEKALYLKMESEGSYGHPGKSRDLDSSMPPDRPKHPNDFKRSMKHLKNLLIKAKGDDKDLPGLREQTPKPVVEAIKAVVAAIQGKKAKAYVKSAYGTEPKNLLGILPVLKQLVPRINTFLDAVEKAREHDGEPGWEIGNQAEALLDKLNSVLIAAFPADLLESDRRQGGEVVLNHSDMANVQDDDAYDSSQEEDEDSDLDDSVEEDVAERLHELKMECASLVDLVTDPTLKERLQGLVFGEVLEGTDGAFRKFSSMVGKADENDLGRAASKLADKLLPQLERL